MPGPGELPQVFETVEALDTRPVWNGAAVAAAEPRLPRPGDTEVRLLGTDFSLQPGEPLLVLGGGPPAWCDVRRVASAEVVQDLLASPADTVPLVPAHTIVTLDEPLAARVTVPDGDAKPPGKGQVAVFRLRQRAAVFGYNAPPYDALPVALRIGEINPHFGEPADSGVLTPAFKPGTGIGMEAKVTIGPAKVLTGAYAGRSSSWADTAFPAGTKTVHLDQVHPRVVARSWAVFERDGAVAVRRVGAVADTPYSDFGLSARSTRLTVTGGDLAGFSPRNATVLVESDRLPLAPWPIVDDVVAVDQLDRAVPVAGADALPVGRTAVVSGQSPDGTHAAEVVVVTGDDGETVRFEATLTGRYRRATVRISGNVAKATHGESRAEVLGSGNQQAAFPSFALRQAPLTHVRSTTPSGARSTLAIWVDGVRWHEVATLYGQASDARVYTTKRAADGIVTVAFGDGVTGARLPSGRDNVVATYRVGIGRAADLAAGRITMPLTRPLGLRDVVNGVAAAGADDPEDLDRARTNAPLAVRALGRVVSLADYADVARAFAGVGKARGDLVWDGRRQVVHLTVAGAGGAAVEPGSALAVDLATAIDRARHASVPVSVGGFVELRLAVTAGLVVDPDQRFPDVAARARAALVDRFSFAHRDFARSATRSEVVAILQAVPGVVAVLVAAFHRVGVPAETADVVVARPARADVDPATGAVTVGLAELLLAVPDDIDFFEHQESGS